MNKYTHFSKKFTPKIPNQDATKKIIEQQIENISPEKYDDFVLKRNRDKFAQSVKCLFKRIIDPRKIYRVLEVGAGTGIITNRLNELENLNVIALDKKRDFLDFAVDHNRIKKNQAVLADFTELPFEDESFDLYTGTAILNQRDDIDKFYKEIVRVLKKDGLIIIPWIRTRKGSIAREKSFFQKYSIKVQQEGEWFLIGKK